ncbi:MAG: hypothetical protein GF331_10150 [Chitinivibrionales bacterium]|nr:hypothetical protein [Chitinivibrionales bacterium]
MGGIMATRKHTMLALAALSTALAVGADKPPIVISRDTVLTHDLFVDSHQTCRIEPGVTIEFDGYHALRVHGMLVALGEEDAPILITGLDRPRGSMERPDWKGLAVVGKAAHVRMRHCRIEGAHANGFWESSGILDSCAFVGNYHGVYSGRDAVPHVRNCRIYRNVYGISVNASTPLLLDNVVSENTVGMHFEYASQSAVGRNILTSNDTDVRTESALDTPGVDLSLQEFWEDVQWLR